MVADRIEDKFVFVGRRERSASAILAVLVQLGLILMWVKQTHVDDLRGRAGNSGVVYEMRLSPLAGAQRRGTAPTHPRRTRPTAPSDQTPAQIKAPGAESADTISSLALPNEAVPTPEPAKKTEPEEPPAMSDSAAAEFAKQWAQLQDDLQKKAIDDVGHHGLKSEPSEPAQQHQMDKTAQTLAEQNQRAQTGHRQQRSDASIFAGELCVTSAGGEVEVQLALPCVGDDFVADFSWHARVHAPKRGEPMMRSVDPFGRVYVRDFKYAPATRAAFEEATEELQKIQVTIRMVYLPELRLPIQLLSRDNRVGAIAAEAFSSEEELAAYLRNWAQNVHRWSAAEMPTGVPPTSPNLGSVNSSTPVVK
jgi:hypothetical protein